MTVIAVIIIALAQIIKADCILCFLGGWSQNVQRHNKCRWENSFWNVSLCSYWKHILNLNVAKQVPDKCIIMEKNREKWWNKRNCDNRNEILCVCVHIYIYIYEWIIFWQYIYIFIQVQRASPAQGSARPPQNEEIHYGQIDFSSRRKEPTSASPLDSKQHTVYSITTVITNSPQIPESVYAQVKI